MRVLLIKCHPSAASYSAAIAERCETTLREAGHDLRVTDLYAIQFNPVMSETEWHGYHDAEINQTPVASHLDDLIWAQALVFVYPTWWFGLPAMLKGYLDRVWIPHVTFEIPSQTQNMRPRMQHIRKIGVVTTCGASWLVSKMMGEPGRKTILRGIRALCAPRCATLFLAHYKMDTSTQRTRTQFLTEIENRLSRF